MAISEARRGSRASIPFAKPFVWNNSFLVTLTSRSFSIYSASNPFCRRSRGAAWQNQDIETFILRILAHSLAMRGEKVLLRSSRECFVWLDRLKSGPYASDFTSWWKQHPEFPKNSKSTLGLFSSRSGHILYYHRQYCVHYHYQNNNFKRTKTHLVILYHQLPTNFPTSLKSLIGADSRRNRVRREWIEKMDDAPGLRKRVHTNQVPHRDLQSVYFGWKKEPTAVTWRFGSTGAVPIENLRGPSCEPSYFG